ncbi:MAG: hypothetical protein GY847_34150 [Proteobacteria bacterium]|nr:hypothetical protein [Pseudomonadota bacterium]
MSIHSKRFILGDSIYSSKTPKEILLLISLLLAVFSGCGDFFGRVGHHQLGNVPEPKDSEEDPQDSEEDPQDSEEDPQDSEEDPQDSEEDPQTLDAGDSEEDVTIADAGMADEIIEIEELEMEDPEALAMLIRDRLAAQDKADSKSEPTKRPHTGTGFRALSAQDNWKLTKRQCLNRLKKEGIRFHKPEFKTPLVTTPLLLDGPIRGVEIKPRWPQAKQMNAVMDCHLVLALIETAKQASNRGIEQILFYSTYRPIRTPPKRCKRGKAGSRCRRLKKAYKKARKSPSQHRTALAIDIRWFVTKGGEKIDVLDHFDRRRRKHPCDYTASTDKGRILQSLTCALYRTRTFNVMLTPNANKAHHNHFHFDITPNAKWYIIR